MTDDVPGITVGPYQCSACDVHDKLNRQYPTDKGLWYKLITEMKRAGKGRDYDCIVGVSGGCDSSYMLWQCVRAGLRCLAVNWDNGWATEIADLNMEKMIEKLDVDFISVVCSDYDDIVKAFLEAGVPDIEAPADIGLAAALYDMAEYAGVKYICEGHSFRTEGVSPLSMLYFDGKYVEDVYWQMRHKLLPSGYDNMKVWDMVRWMAIKGIRKVRPLYLIDYRKANAKAELMRNCGWRDYGGHHCENKLTAWYHDVFMPMYYDVNTRVLGWSALVRSGQLTRAEGRAHLGAVPVFPTAVNDEVTERLGLPKATGKTHRDFKTYHKLFRRTKLFWWILVKLGLMPASFMKYTRKEK
jgi:hypothetical protein